MFKIFLRRPRAKHLDKKLKVVSQRDILVFSTLLSQCYNILISDFYVSFVVRPEDR